MPSQQDTGKTEERVTITEVLDQFLAEQQERLAKSTFRRYEDAVDLLRLSLDSYAHQNLSESERQFWERRFERDEQQGSFCNTFGPGKIAENLGEFLGYFMVRKVAAAPDRLRAVGTMTQKLADWLEEHGWIEAEEASEARERGAAAARELPLAYELTDLLWDASEEKLSEPVLEEWDDDLAMISRAERGKIWFHDYRREGDVGPVLVPPRAGELAQPNWCVSAVLLGRTRTGWRILEVGSVYP